MFEKPTVNDFLDQLRMQQAEVALEFDREKNRILGDASAHGRLRSGMTIDRILEAVGNAVRDGASRMLGELRRAIEKTDLDQTQLRQLTIPRLNELTTLIIEKADLDRICEWVNSDTVKRIVQERIDALRTKLNFWIRQFDVGFDEPADREGVGVVTNIVHARDVAGGIQQGQGTLTQNTTVQIDRASAIQALAVLDEQLPKLAVSGELLGEF